MIQLPDWIRFYPSDPERNPRPHPMLTKSIVTVLSLLATIALAQTEGTPSPAPLETTFEAAGLVETKMFLPENLMKGRLHTVHQQAENDGLRNTYFLYSGDRVFEVDRHRLARASVKSMPSTNCAG